MRVEEPTIDETVQILRGLRDRYEAHHRCKISDEALQPPPSSPTATSRTATFPTRRSTSSTRPGSRVRIATMSAPPRYRELEEEIDKVRADKEGAIEAQEFEKAAQLRDKERKLTQKKKELEEEWRNQADEEQPEIGEDEIADIVSMWTGIPVFKLTEAESAAARPDGGRAAQARHRPAPGDRRRREGDPARPRGHQGPRSARPARSSSSARRASGRPSSRARSPSSSSATRTR